MGVQLSPLPGLTSLQMNALDKVYRVKVDARASNERVRAPWFTIHGLPDLQSFPELVTHNDNGFRISLDHLLSHLVNLRQTLVTCLKFRTAFTVEAINKVARLAKSCNMSGMNLNEIAQDKAYLGGLHKFSFDRQAAATRLFAQIKSWPAVEPSLDAIMTELGARVVNNRLVFDTPEDTRPNKKRKTK